MVVDTSVLVAIARQEEGWQVFEAALHADTALKMSAATYVELRIVLLRGMGESGTAIMDRILESVGMAIVSVDAEIASLAVEAFRRFGKGRHPAGLNFGDCFSYALAMQHGEPLLFKGDDFSKTDVQRA